MNFILRFIGLLLLALAVVMAVLDLTRSISASAFVMTPLYSTWETINLSSLKSVREWMELSVSPFLWDPIFLTILSLPTWILAWFVAMLCLWLGQKREKAYGRFSN